VATECPDNKELTATGIVPDSNRIPFYWPLRQVRATPFSVANIAINKSKLQERELFFATDT
jgi:hypothetical protein